MNLLECSENKKLQLPIEVNGYQTAVVEWKQNFPETIIDLFLGDTTLQK